MSPSVIHRSASRCRPWRFAAWRLGVALGNSLLGVLLLPLAICRSASRCCPQRLSLVSHLSVSKVYQSAFGISISVQCTNQRTLALSCQNDPRRRHVPIAYPGKKHFYTVLVFFCRYVYKFEFFCLKVLLRTGFGVRVPTEGRDVRSVWSDK